MNPILLNKNFPVFLYENFFILNDFQKEHLINHVFLKKGQEQVYVPPGYKAFNLSLESDNLGILNHLYDMFIERLIKDFDASIDYNKSKKQFWTYCTNRLYPYYVWHNHLKSSTMHCVYYLNVPFASGGEIDFELNGDFFSFKPKRYDLIIMPDFLNHAPRQSLSDEYRISINMQAYCKNSSVDILNNFLKKSISKNITFE